MDVKARLRQLIDERGWSLYRVSKEANIPWTTVHNMFKRNTDPSIQTLESLCKGMGITLTQFFDVDDDMGLSFEQKELIKKWGMLRDKDKRLLSDLIDSLNK